MPVGIEHHPALFLRLEVRLGRPELASQRFARLWASPIVVAALRDANLVFDDLVYDPVLVIDPA
jgi:hypothetical protein